MTIPLEISHPIPPRIKIAIDRYVKYGIQPGGFVMAVLSNNLVGAVRRADDTSLKALPNIVHYVNDKIPHNAWGSLKIVEAWISSRMEVD